MSAGSRLRVFVRTAARVGAVALGLAACADAPSSPAGPLALGPEDGIRPLSGHVEAFVDETGTLTINDVRGPAAARFRAIPPGSYVQGQGAYGRPGWLRFTLRNDSDAPLERVIELGSATIDEVQAWSPALDGAGWRAGLATGLDDRAVHHPAFRFPVSLAPGESETWHLRVRDEGSIATSLVVGDRDALDTTWALRQLFDGTVVVLLLWALVLGVGAAVTERSRAAWAFASTTFGLFLAHAFFFWGLPAYLIPVDVRPWAANRLAVVTTPFVWAGLTTLGLHTLDLRRHAPRLARALVVAVTVLFANTGILVLVSYATTFPVQHLATIAALVLLLAGTTIRAARGHAVALSLLATFVIFLVSYVFLVLRTLGTHGLLTDLLFNVATLLFVSGLVGALRQHDSSLRAEREAALLAHADEADRSVRRSTSLERFVPREALRLLHAGPRDTLAAGEVATPTLTVVAATLGEDEVADETEAFRRLAAWASAAEGVVAAHHGFVHALDGRTLLGLFPQATADEALGAARAIVALAPRAVRVGVHRGPVVLGTIGGSRWIGVAAYGVAIAEARALAEGAGPSTVVLSEAAVLAASPTRWSVRTLDAPAEGAGAPRRYGLEG